MAKSQNAAMITKAQLIKMLEEASDKGATKALCRIGLHDEDAVHDVKELRNLLDGWRDTRKNVRCYNCKGNYSCYFRFHCTG